MSGETHWDVVIAGAGAAGLIAAIRSAERGRRTLLLEKNRRPGVKILMSGGTRCNLTHATDRRGIISAFSRQQGNFLQSALAAFTPQDLVALVEAEGVATKIEETGKIFPQSDRATDILQAFLDRQSRSGAVLATHEALMNCERDESGFRVVTSNRELTCTHLMITTGGQSYPGSGTTGDGYAWARRLGHTICPLTPALTPILADEAWVKELQGITVPSVHVRVLSRETALQTHAGAKVPAKAVLAERKGSFLFTHFGLSGPSVLDVSRAVSGHPHPETLVLRCDFLPEQTEQQLEGGFQQMAGTGGKRTVAAAIGDWLPKRLSEVLIARGNVSLDRRLAELTRLERTQLVAALKRQDISIQGTRGYKKAEVTAGGVSLDEVDSRTMQSKLVPGLFFAGEILDIDGPIGGYNFQAAFSTGWLAGSYS